MTNGKNKIEAIFSERNIDEDCDTIARLLSPYREIVRESLSKGYYAKASLTTLWKTSITTISMTCTVMMEAVIDAIKGGNFPDVELQHLKDGLDKLKHTEAYEDYGTPYALNIWEKFERKTK